MSAEREESAWTCPRCHWVQTAHPLYGWQQHDQRAIEVHRATLCPAAEREAAEVCAHGVCRVVNGNRTCIWRELTDKPVADDDGTYFGGYE